ncbi:D-alanyl-D-alanine carboxypeptidase [Stappia sp. GBMRC 2046]|uniref:D-alanyl-D-alanine carboxypeptidase n=1 Tax=Stappia sediminis TaxID=2692190 RepID=A0A7X3LR62_9HYPH|nr:D-alanyl-D-alanine carboxypeptidase family protein [Stappia sediminis]MXN63573.1 D-alanyl-D-alanine carboxypeptidase [Stappia sediminis]
MGSARIRTRLNGFVAALGLLALAACQSVTPQGAASVPSSTTAAPAVAAVNTLSLAPVPAKAEARARAEIVIDARSGKALYELDADAPRYPASLTKMMTLYLLFEEVSAGKLNLDSPLRVSANAASQPPAKIGVKAGSTISVKDAAQAIAVKSGNDVAVVIAENISGSERAFARKMTQKAQALGMRRTRFVNASGLPDTAQVTTARDMATLARALKTRFPQYASYFRARSFSYGGRTFKATNNLLGRVAGVDGMKTGYIRLSGFNLAASARRGGKSLIVVVMGGPSEGARDRRVAELIEENF